jgi:hypothetical protein
MSRYRADGTVDGSRPESTVTIMACRNCKPAFSEGAAYCPYCGEDELRWRRKRHALYLLIGIGMLLIMAAAFFIITRIPRL